MTTKEVMKVQITNEAKNFLEDVMNEQGAGQMRVVFAGMG